MDIANGEGIRVSLFVSGCGFHCTGCFNPEYQSYEYGNELTKEVQNHIISLLNNSNISGLSILGGDPLFQSLESLIILNDFISKVISQTNKTIWLWSGYTWEQLFDDNEYDLKNICKAQYQRSIISMCDVFVDGQFIDEQKDMRLQFRGSNNQRVIDVKSSLKKEKVILHNIK